MLLLLLIMIRLISKLFKCFKQISFENEIDIFDEYIKSLNIDALVCPICGAKYSLSLFASYKRHFVTYDNDAVHDNIVTISRYICSSCRRTHALLPSVIVPYLSFSFRFSVNLIHDYLVINFILWKLCANIMTLLYLHSIEFYISLRNIKKYGSVF